MTQCDDATIALTVTSPPYWNAIDYDLHAKSDKATWYREREYASFGETFEDYLRNIELVFTEVKRVTVEGGFCAIVVGTILQKGRHLPAPMLITARMVDIGWEFHQDFVWHKVTGGVKRAGVFIQQPKSGYFYPNIMTEYVLVFRKSGDLRRGRTKAMEIDALYKKEIANNVWHIAPVPPHTIEHPCPFPEELARRLVVLYSDPGEWILDPFLGSGQTALAALRHERRCVGYDIEQEYVELAADRLRHPPTIRPFNLIANFEKLAVE